jgi:hypothetical protein
MNEGELAGMIPRAVYDLFGQLDQLPNATWRVRVSHVEIYNERFYDLLESGSRRRVSEVRGKLRSRRLRIVEGPDKRVGLKGAREVAVRSPHDIFRIMRKSIRNRHTAETRCNRQSSRLVEAGRP